MNKKMGSILMMAVILVVGSTVMGGTVWLEKDKLLASDGTAGDLFGSSVSISGDYAIVGAKSDDDHGSYSGSAYIFKFDGATWVQQQKLHALDSTNGDYFGQSVSISGDYAIIGALFDDDNGNESGSAYIFNFDGTNWVQQQKLIASDGVADDCFGYSVSINGDHAIVGARDDDDNGTNSGSAYIFKFDGTNWIQQAKLLASEGTMYDMFGNSVSISGNHAIVGAYADDVNGNESGSAYTFRFDGTNWNEQQKLLPSDCAAGDYFGYSVSISNDLAIVGAHWNDDKGSDSGSAYVFKFDGTDWIQQQKLLASDGAAGNGFGYSVSISSDLAIIGAAGDDDNGSGSGSAYIFRFDGTKFCRV